MELIGKKILLISPEPWDHMFVSKHHYATHLSKRENRVFFLNPPSGKYERHFTHHKDIVNLDYPGFPMGYRYLPRFFRDSLTRKVYNRLEVIAKQSFDIIWSFDNSVFFDFSSLPDAVLKISHIVDLNMDFEIKRSSKSADICLYTTRAIGKKLNSFTNRSYFVNHGFSFNEKAKPISIPSKGNIKVGYAGNLDIKYLDWNLIEEVVRANSTIDFYFAGSCKNSNRLKWFRDLSNVSYMGILDSLMIQSFYTQMDILLITYLSNDYPQQLGNPHKIMEYLASGKPVVATYTSEYEGKGLLYMSRNNNEWPSLFQDAVRNLKDYSSKDLVAERKNYALENTYNKQLDRIEEILSSLPK